ncbi:PUA domain-containing protein [Hyperthermus butylicus]|uniref:Conserved archaeal protein n=1 Tax=Hyperthermus butylicus (strain DSM 5456 / JCM 9403 / PLM1-5) TaxID=415426 RepID=A2BN18_HYPBU|nr:hypothetical protein [Hyperthermus butylicus]ABM81379.1 conserved archaeal protein [Hyperthermus butylicus DSM 5456]
MQVGEEKKLGMCSSEIRDLLRGLVECIVGVDVLKHYSLLCKHSSGIVDVYALLGELYRYLDSSVSVEPFTAGVHIARIRRRRLIPLLGLAQLLRREAGWYRAGYVIVTEHAEKLFLYGRDVFQSSIEAIAEYTGSCNKYDTYLVLNKRMEPLGWGRLVKYNNRIYIQNIVDAGWYLRSGV